MEIIRASWAGTTLRHAGEFYRAIGARPGPRPAHDIGLWLGVIGPRALRLAGEVADGWVPSMSYVPPARAALSNAIIDEAARGAGRDPAAIRRIYNIGGDVTPVVEAGGGESDEDQQIVGPRDHWVSVLTRLATDHGFSTFVLWGVPTAPRLRMFVEDIAPAVRERVAEVRASRPGFRARWDNVSSPPSWSAAGHDVPCRRSSSRVRRPWLRRDRVAAGPTSRCRRGR